jgi:hypothetical protein
MGYKSVILHIVHRLVCVRHTWYCGNSVAVFTSKGEVFLQSWSRYGELFSITGPVIDPMDNK